MKRIILSSLLVIGFSQAGLASTCKVDKGLIEKGKAAYKTATCNLCHGDNGAGDGPAAAGLNPKPRNLISEPFKNKKGATIEGIYDVTTNGLPGTTMTAYKHLPEADRCAISNYVLSLRKK